MNISELCYELYKEDWKHSNIITKDMEIDSIKNYYECLITDDIDSKEYTYNDYLEEVGYNGKLYVCYEEFLDNEYLKEDYIKELLDNDNLYEIYLQDLNN